VDPPWWLQSLIPLTSLTQAGLAGKLPIIVFKELRNRSGCDDGSIVVHADVAVYNGATGWLIREFAVSRFTIIQIGVASISG
jgi:hypothetical protein